MGEAGVFLGFLSGDTCDSLSSRALLSLDVSGSAALALESDW